MAYYKLVSRWTRKRRTDNELRKVMQELHCGPLHQNETCAVETSSSQCVESDSVEGTCYFESDNDDDVNLEPLIL